MNNDLGFRMSFPVEESLNVATFDLETVKLPSPKGKWSWASGETNSMRWLPVVFGFAYCWRKKLHVICFYENDEKKFIEMANGLLEWGTKNFGSVGYCSRNKFDEMILRGRFINGRRSLAKLPTKDWPIISEKINLEQFPSLPNGKLYDRKDEGIDWKDLIYGSKASVDGRHLISSRFNEKLGAIMNHCARDVTENLGLKVLS